MKTIVIALPGPIGQSLLDSLQHRAEQALEFGVIKALPQVTVEPASFLSFEKIVLTVSEGDWPFWFGFYLGKDFVVNNRGIFLD